ncbi:MAG: acetyl-CoA carboxylase biotin carboxyl carrier protein [Candidatus Omnitrophica bacterium]|nr:acetyl-CoA carboxylase biotin carboxyl carrier protein [Candidatus Omnitrophota bacterium]
MYIKEIKDMINLMNENSLTELEIEKEGVRIKLRKGAGGGVEKAIEFVPAPQVPAQQVKSAEAAGKEEARKTVDIKSPMVGTFYRAPSPEAPPYVNMGDTISPGQVICIIEAMKLMNEIKADVKGKIVDIQVDNAEPVEFGQALFVIEPV